MSECVEFLEDETLLQDINRKMGVVTERKSKCHPKLVGEDIGYYWGFYKNAYHRLPISKKRGKDKFIGNVWKCLSREKLTTYLIRKFTKQVRRYIFSYYLLQHSKGAVQGDLLVRLSSDACFVSAENIDRMVNNFKTH